MILRLPALALALTVAAAPLYAAEQTVRLSVPGMYCASCPFIVEAAIGSLDGVKSVDADATIREAVVVYDDAITTLEDIQFASLEAGYEATLIDNDS